MRIETVSEASSLENTAIDISYIVYVCDNCGHMFIDLSSLQEAWKQVFEEFGIPSAQTLKHAREVLGITTSELADVFDKSKSLILKIENGARRPSSKMLSLYKNYVLSGPTAFAGAVRTALKEGVISNDKYNTIMSKLFG